MKILFVSIPNHHFFQWANQLKNAGYEVHWFDITDGAGFSNKINWVTQYNGWKLRWNYPGRYFIKRKLSAVYNFINKFNTQDVEVVFDKLIKKIQPDIVHCFDMELTGLPILSVMNYYSDISFIYSSWGSDIFYFRERGIDESNVAKFLKRVDYLITDCERDFKIAKKNGFARFFLGVFPGNGGLSLDYTEILNVENRNIIMLKGYQYDVGEAIQIVKAIEKLPLELISKYNIIIYSTDKIVESYINQSHFYRKINTLLFPRNGLVKNEELLKIMGKSIIHIGNNLSDGMPNTLLEAMGMGAFPIQSNPGKATEEVITDGQNGFLIENPLDVQQIANLIEVALKDKVLRKSAQEYNVSFINKNYNRVTLQPKIIKIYQDIVS